VRLYYLNNNRLVPSLQGTKQFGKKVAFRSGVDLKEMLSALKYEKAK
jgi:hypothetical protein